MKNNLIEITNGRIRSEKNLGIGLATMSTPTCKDNKDMQSLSVPQLSEYSEPKLKTPVDVRCIKKKKLLLLLSLSNYNCIIVSKKARKNLIKNIVTKK